MFEHEPIYDSRLSFRTASSPVSFVWTGLVDLAWKPGYIQGVRVRAFGRAVFSGVLCGRASEVIARSKLGALLPQDQLDHVVDMHGVSRLVPKHC